MGSDPHQTGDEWRMIDVAPLQVFAARVVVKLVDKVSIACCGQKMEQEFQRSNP
jgi:hypothetical protein